MLFYLFLHKNDSQVLSQKKCECFTGVKFIVFGTIIEKLEVLRGVRGYSPTRFVFRAHEMRILRRSVEHHFQKIKAKMGE